MRPITRHARTLSAAAILVAAAGANAAIDFTSGTPLATASRPAGAAIADFNGDGRGDLAVTVDNPDRILVMFGNGDGTFGVPTPIITGAGTGADSILAVNVDGDADVDLVVALHSSNAVRTYINNGVGSFSLGTTTATGEDPRKLAAADLDGDADLDFLVANRDTNNVSVIRNDAGVLAPAISVPAGGDPRAVAAGDFDGDGDADIAVSNHDDRTITIHSGNGPFAYTLTATLAVPPGTRSDGIAVADLDADGDLDLAAAISDQAFNVVSIYTNNAGVFANPISFNTGGLNASEILLTDLDLDGRIDAVTSNADTGNISVLQNTSAAGGPISFGAASVIATGATPGQAAAGDLDADTFPDLAVPNRDANTTSILINATQRPCAADFNNDGAANSQDFFDYLTAFFALAPNADFNNDAIVNSQDFFDFLTAFFVGCP
jgi:hypothetical protein